MKTSPSGRPAYLVLPIPSLDVDQVVATVHELGSSVDRPDEYHFDFHINFGYPAT